MNKKRVLAIIPARGGSKGIPRKNLLEIGGKPLIAYSIQCAKQIERINSVVVSTDDSEIAEVAIKYGARIPVLRPKELADDHAKTIDAVEHMLEFLESCGEVYDTVVLLQPTQPFRSLNDVERALNFFEANNSQGVLTVSRVQEHPLLMRYMTNEGYLSQLLSKESTVRRQDMEPVFRVNGAVYVNAREDYRRGVSLNDNPLGVLSGEGASIDIDSWKDVEEAEFFLKQR